MQGITDDLNLYSEIRSRIASLTDILKILMAGGIELIKILCPPLGIPIEMGRKWLDTARKTNDL